MKKLFVFVGILMIALTLVGCDDTTIDVIPPTFEEAIIENIEPFDGTDLVTFYKGRNAELEVKIVLDNPSLAPVTSIVINGYNYRFTRFTESSTNEIIYFNISTGTALGETVYSVDEIIYQNGDNSETVYINNNNEFKVYVYKDTPTVERENYALDRDSISVDFVVTDFNTVIELGTLVAELYSGETLIDEKPLFVGESNVSFEGLLANKHYEIKVNATYDLDDSFGVREEVPLYSGLFATLSNSLPSGQIQNVNIDSNTVTFDVVYNDDDDVTLPGGLSVGVYLDNVLIQEVGLMASTADIVFDDLLNDNEYVLKVVSDYNLRDGTGTLPGNIIYTFGFTTAPQDVPEPIIYNLDVEENRVLFDISIDDPDGLIDTSTLVAKLYIDGIVVKEANMIEYTVDFVLFNLLSDYEFVIEIEASYDLNDGDGLLENQVIFSETFTTLINQPPVVYVDDIVVTQGYVTIDLEVADTNETLKGAFSAILYENDVTVDTIVFDIETLELVFQYLVKNTESYRVEIISDYNLRDGYGTHYDQVLFSSTQLSVEPKAPAAELINIVPYNDSISLTVKIMDSDLTVVDGSLEAYLYLDGLFIEMKPLVIGLNEVLFENLLSNNEYVIYVYADYDLIDGTGLQLDQMLITGDVLTLEKEIPSVIITEENSDTEAITFNVSVEDPDLVFEDLTLRAVLYLEGVATGAEVPLVVGNNYDVTFAGLLSDNLYYIEIIGDYDLDDGNGIVTDLALGEVLRRTLAKVGPSAIVLDIDADQDTIVLDVVVYDDDNVISENLMAVLFIEDEILGLIPTGVTLPLVVGLNSSVTFNNVLSDARYLVRIYTDYDLNDGTDAILNEELDYYFATTIKKELMEAFITEIILGKLLIEFDVEVIDEDGVIASNLKAVLYQEGLPTGQELSLVLGHNLGLSFPGLQSDSMYVIQIEADIDFNEGIGVESARLFADQVVYTEALIVPTAEILVGLSFNTEIQFGAFITDDDGTITNNFKAVLYQDGVLVDEIPLLVLLNPLLTFTGLEFGKDYEIAIVTDYNLNDGELDIPDFEMTSELGTTVGIVELTNVVEEKLKIFFMVEIDDQFSVLTDPELTVAVYDENDILVGNIKTLSTSQNMQLLNLWSNYDYYMIVSATYDVGLGPVTTEVYRHEFHTLELDVPPLSISSLYVNPSLPQIIFNVMNVIDPDVVVIPGTLVVNLYRDGILVDTYLLGLGFDNEDITFDFDGTDGAEYVLKIEATVDMNDSLGQIVDFEIYTTSFVYTDKN